MTFKALMISAVLAGTGLFILPSDARHLQAQHGDLLNPAATSKPSNNNNGILLMANGPGTSTSSSSSSSATASASSSTQNGATDSPEVTCTASAKAIVEVNGQRKVEDDRKIMHGAGNGCKVTARARAVTKPERLPEE